MFSSCKLRSCEICNRKNILSIGEKYHNLTCATETFDSSQQPLTVVRVRHSGVRNSSIVSSIASREENGAIRLASKGKKGAELTWLGLMSKRNRPQKEEGFRYSGRSDQARLPVLCRGGTILQKLFLFVTLCVLGELRFNGEFLRALVTDYFA